MLPTSGAPRLNHEGRCATCDEAHEAKEPHAKGKKLHEDFGWVLADAGHAGKETAAGQIPRCLDVLRRIHCEEPESVTQLQRSAEWKPQPGNPEQRLSSDDANQQSDPDDLGDFITCFFTNPPCADADFNNDGNTDPDDLGDFITAFFGPPC